jgi:hypothetical protein
MSDFYEYFKENMDALNLSAPESLYGNLMTAVSSAQAILSQIEKYGKKVTLREIAVAGSRLEQLAFIGTLGACYYVGAVVGSMAVATGRKLSGGTSLSDVLMSAYQNGLLRPWLREELIQSPEIYARRYR